MENEQVAPAPAVAPPDSSLDAYRAAFDKPAEKPVAEEPKPVAAAPPVEPGDPIVGEDDDDVVETPRKKLGGFQKTIARQAAEIEELKKRAAPAAPAAGAPVPAASASAAPEPKYGVPKPLLEDCDGIEDFTEKLTDWKADERDFRKAAKDRIAADAAAATNLAANWNAQKTAFKAEHDDWDAVMAAVSDVRLSPAHQEIFLESPHGVELAYELANDREELERIAKLSPLAAARAIGKLEAAYGPKKAVAAADAEAAEEAKPVKVSSARPPFKPVAGNNARVTPNVATMSISEYRKAVDSGRFN